MLTQAAYGFRLEGLSDGDWLSLHGAEGWPVLTLTYDATVSRYDQARVHWARRHAEICPDLPPDEIPHPLLGRMLTLLATERGVDALHAGVLLGGDGAWAIIGAPQAGKSSLLAECDRVGAQVLSDDLLVLEQLHCLAGPRCIDLRRASAARFGPSVAVRGGTKHRIRLPPAPAETSLAGVIHLAWGPATELIAVPPSEGVARIAALRAASTWPRSASLILDLATLPTFELRRPQRLASLDGSARLLLEHIGAAHPLRISADGP